MHEGLDALGEGGIAAVAEQWAQVVAALADGSEQGLRAGGGLAVGKGGAQVVEVAGGQARERGAKLREGLALNLADEVGMSRKCE